MFLFKQIHSVESFSKYMWFAIVVFWLKWSGLPQQGILLISAKKNTIANHIYLEKNFHCPSGTLKWQ